MKAVVADILIFLMVKRLLIHVWYHDNLALFSTTVFFADAEH